MMFQSFLDKLTAKMLDPNAGFCQASQGFPIFPDIVFLMPLTDKSTGSTWLLVTGGWEDYSECWGYQSSQGQLSFLYSYSHYGITLLNFFEDIHSLY